MLLGMLNNKVNKTDQLIYPFGVMISRLAQLLSLVYYFHLFDALGCKSETVSKNSSTDSGVCHNQ